MQFAWAKAHVHVQQLHIETVDCTSRPQVTPIYIHPKTHITSTATSNVGQIRQSCQNILAADLAGESSAAVLVPCLL